MHPETLFVRPFEHEQHAVVDVQLFTEHQAALPRFVGVGDFGLDDMDPGRQLGLGKRGLRFGYPGLWRGPPGSPRPGPRWRGWRSGPPGLSWTGFELAARQHCYA